MASHPWFSRFASSVRLWGLWRVKVGTWIVADMAVCGCWAFSAGLRGRLSLVPQFALRSMAACNRLIVPATACGPGSTPDPAGCRAGAFISRSLRASRVPLCSKFLQQDYMRTCASEGHGQTELLFVHSLAKRGGARSMTVNASAIALSDWAGRVTETVFAIPGVGRLTVDAILRTRLSGHPGHRAAVQLRLCAGHLVTRPTLHRLDHEDPVLTDCTRRHRLPPIGFGRCRPNADLCGIQLRVGLAGFCMASPRTPSRRPSGSRMVFVRVFARACNAGPDRHRASRRTREPSAVVPGSHRHAGAEVYSRRPLRHSDL